MLVGVCSAANTCSRKRNDSPAQVGFDAWAQMHNGHVALLRPEAARSEIYESVWQASQDEQSGQPTQQPMVVHPQLQSSTIPTLTAPALQTREETISVRFPADAVSSVAVAAVVESICLWTPEQIEAFARGLMRG